LRTVALVIMALVLPACASQGDATRAPRSCDARPPGDVAQSVSFRGTVSSFEARALHVDFEGSGTDFDAVHVALTAPAHWRGISVPVYVQGNPLKDGRAGPAGEVAFIARVPACMDQPWAFLDTVHVEAEDAASGKHEATTHP
jgi:hypothetical protein